jgi:hypothetical protein
MSLATTQTVVVVSTEAGQLHYYNIAGTGSGNFPAVCETPVDQAIASIHANIQAGLAGQDVAFIYSDSALRMRDDLLQQLFIPPIGMQGWPHRNSLGAQALAGLVDLPIGRA